MMTITLGLTLRSLQDLNNADNISSAKLSRNGIHGDNTIIEYQSEAEWLQDALYISELASVFTMFFKWRCGLVWYTLPNSQTVGTKGFQCGAQSAVTLHVCSWMSTFFASSIALVSRFSVSTIGRHYNIFSQHLCIFIVKFSLREKATYLYSNTDVIRWTSETDAAGLLEINIGCQFNSLGLTLLNYGDRTTLQRPLVSISLYSLLILSSRKGNVPQF